MALAVHDVSSIEEAWEEYERLGEKLAKAVEQMKAQKLGSLHIDNEAYRLRGVDCLKRWVRAVEVAIEDRRVPTKTGRVQYGDRDGNLIVKRRRKTG